MGKRCKLTTIQGVHQCVAVGDQRKATIELLEQRLKNWDRAIADWKPDNAWDAANKRPLKYMKTQRTWCQEYLDRIVNKEK